MLGGLFGPAWLSVAPNRLLPGQGLTAFAALGPSALLIAAPVLAPLLVRLAARGPVSGRLPWLLLALALLGTAAALWGTGAAAMRLLEGRPPAARAGLGPGFWLALAGLGILLAEAARALRLPPAVLLAGVGVLVGCAAWLGLFDALSLTVEYRARADLVRAALGEHLGLAAAALLFALVLVVPLGLWAFRSPRVEAVLGAALDGVQVVPAIALFGVLVPLLSSLLNAAPALRELGLSAIGPTPALIGTAAYLGLPLARAVVGGLRAADPEVIAAARAMGLTEGRIAAEVRLPLGLPVIVAGLRVAAVQAISLTTLGGLIGAGGLGALVFEGMAQFATDLILLGALPIVALALLADALLRAGEERLATARSGP